jgi:ABC-type proline/glycine betaine transport system ATPase subunit
VIKRFIMHSKKSAFIVEHDFIMATYLADRVIVYDGRPGVTCCANTPQTLLTGMNRFLEGLEITFRRDPENHRCVQRSFVPASARRYRLRRERARSACLSQARLVSCGATRVRACACVRMMSSAPLPIPSEEMLLPCLTALTHARRASQPASTHND